MYNTKRKEIEERTGNVVHSLNPPSSRDAVKKAEEVEDMSFEETLLSPELEPEIKEAAQEMEKEIAGIKTKGEMLAMAGVLLRKAQARGSLLPAMVGLIQKLRTVCNSNEADVRKAKSILAVLARMDLRLEMMGPETLASRSQLSQVRA